MTNDVFAVFRQNVKKYREDRGWSQLRLAVDCELSEDCISDIERGKYTPNLEIIVKLAEAFGIKPCKLLTEKQNCEMGY